MRQRRFPRRFSQAGVTLVEVLVALVIFALIGAAGFTVLDQVARVDRLTEGRLARLAAMQRAMRVLSVDFAQARAQGLTGQGGAVVVQRSGGAAFGGPVVLRYGLEPVGSEPGGLTRSLYTAKGEAVVQQVLLAGIASAEWQFLDDSGDWRAEWPPADAPASLAPPQNPRAVAVTLSLAEGGTLRRVAPVPGPLP